MLLISWGCRRDSPVSPAPSQPLSAQEAEPDTAGNAHQNPSLEAQMVLQAARQSLTHAQYQQAAKQLQPLLVRDPHHVEALFLLAQAHAGQGRLEEAVDVLRLIPPEHRELGLAALGQASDWLIELRRYDEAQSRLEQIVRLDGQIAMAQRRLAQLLNNRGHRIEAAGPLRALARLGEVTSEELYGLGTFSDPFIHANENPHAPEIVVSPLAEARVMYFDDQPREAATLAESVRVNHPQSPTAAAFALRLAADLQDDSWFARILAELPPKIADQPEYWYALGTWYQQREQHAFAIRCFLEAVQRDDTDRFSYLKLARSLESEHQPTQAKRVFERFQLLDEAAQINSELNRSPEQLTRMGWILRRLHRPYEAVAWERLAHRSDSQAGSDLEEVPTDWRVCGMKLSDWPLPESTVTASANQQPVSLSLGGDLSRESSTTNRIRLVNVAERSGLQFRYRPKLDDDRESLVMPETVGGGIGVLDYDLDGWPDVYFNQGGGRVTEPQTCLPKRLYRNLAGHCFQDVSTFSQSYNPSYGQGVAVADLNQDGFSDLVVANIGPNDLYLNNGDGTFRKTALVADSNQWTTSIACGDLSGDGLPEIVEVNYIDDPQAMDAPCVGSTRVPLCNPQRYRAAVDRFLINREDGKFAIWGDTQPSVPAGFGFAALIANFDGKNGNELFVANDTSGNHYWVSQKDPRTTDRFILTQQAELLGCARGAQGVFQSSMGIAAGDFDRNGRLDLQITNYTDESSDLYLQQASGIFANQNYRYGLDVATKAQLGWGTQAADFDQDGWLDLAIVNSNLYNHSNDGTPYRMSPQVICGGLKNFVEVDRQTLGDTYWATPTLGRTLATIDWNRDGRVDLVATHLDAPAALLENQPPSEPLTPSQQPHWIQLELVGTTTERDAIGARIVVSRAGETLSAWVCGGDGYLCSNDPIITIGLGQIATIDSLEIVWSGTHRTVLESPATDQRYLVIQNEAQPWSR